VLEVAELQAGYGDVQVLWEVTFEIRDREIVALVGANGAGKTTLLRTVSGIIVPTKGQIQWEGRSIGGMRPEQVVRLGISHVPEGRHLFPGLTVRENLMIGAYHRRDGRVHSDLEWVLELFPRVKERLQQVAGRLSGGEQQMCAVARGLMSRPKLIMIDELSLGLAPKVVEGLLERLPEITQGGASVLIVDQDVDAALDVAARGYVLETGRIVARGPSEELLAEPRIQEAYLGVA
jgi:branched-chain amino acid transport system ATP-binding protein